MNSTRRIKVSKIKNVLLDAKEVLECILEEEEECRDNTPENLQTSERYEESEECCNKLDDAISSVEDAITSLEEVT